MNTTPSRFHKYLNWFSNASTLLVLASLGIWGHLNHWQLPRFSTIKSAWQLTAGKPGDDRGAGKNESPPEAPPGASDAGEPGRGGGDERFSTPASRFPSAAEPRLPVVWLPSRDAVRKIGILIESAQSRELEEFVRLNGEVDYDQTRLAQLSARVPGIAWRVEKHVGDHVRKGEILAILDSLDVGKGKAEFLQAVIAYELKSENLERLEQITSSIPDRVLREAAAAVREAGIRRFNAEQTLINLGLPLTPKIAQGLSDEELTRKIQFLGIPETIVSELEPNAATANLIPLVAPFGGVLINREIVTGEVVQAAQTQFVIADVSRMWLKLSAKESDAPRLRIGQQIRFVSDGVPGEVLCNIAWIGTQVDEKTRTVPVRGETDNPVTGSAAGAIEGPRRLRAHMFGTARIRVRDERRAVMVPNSAVQWDGTRHLVFIPRADGRSFEPRAVDLGTSRGGQTEVVEGIAAGEPVVSAGSYVLKSELGRQLKRMPP